MKNIPMFTTDAGVASLILEEIPYKKEAYIRIQTAIDPQLLIEDSVAFCKTAGADVVYATGHAFLNQYPFYTEIINMTCRREELPPTKAELCPIQPETMQLWCEIYNVNMSNVANAATMTIGKLKSESHVNNCYFVYENELLIGIGMAQSCFVDALVSVIPGKGKDVLSALSNALTENFVTVTVAVNNKRAISLYRKLGFIEKESISKWYCVYGHMRCQEKILDKHNTPCYNTADIK